MSMKKLLSEGGVTFLELILGVAIGAIAIMGSVSLFNMVYKTEEKFSKIMEVDDIVAKLGGYLMKGTDRVLVSHLDPDYTFYDIVESEDINSKLDIVGVDNMNIFKVGVAFYSPDLPPGFTDPAELWEETVSPIRVTPIFYRNSYTLKYLDNVGGTQILASRCIDPIDFDKSFSTDEVLDLEYVPHVYKTPGSLNGQVAFVRCCPIGADFPNCSDNDLLPRIFHINAHQKVEMYPKPRELKFLYDASFGIYMKSAFNPDKFYLRFNINIKDCDSKALQNLPTQNCNKKNTRKFIEVERTIRSSNLSGGVI